MVGISPISDPRFSYLKLHYQIWNWLHSSTLWAPGFLHDQTIQDRQVYLYRPMYIQSGSTSPHLLAVTYSYLNKGTYTCPIASLCSRMEHCKNECGFQIRLQSAIMRVNCLYWIQLCKTLYLKFHFFLSLWLLLGMPDREDRLIMALGLGSTGHDYSSTSLPARPRPRLGWGWIRYQWNHNQCRKDSLVCHSYVESRGEHHGS